MQRQPIFSMAKLAVLIAVMAGAGTLQAAEAAQQTTEAKTNEAKSAKESRDGDDATSDSAGNAEKSREEVDRELLELLEGPSVGGASGRPDPLENAIGDMRSAQERIAEKQIGSETKELQQRIVDELDKLIQLAKNRQPSSRPPQSSPNQQSDSQQDQPKPSPQSRQPRPKNGPSDRNQQKSTDSDEQNRKRARLDQDAQALRNQRGVKEVWGHLPERLRDQLRIDFGGDALPVYQELVRKYFTALAEGRESANNQKRN